MQPLANPASQHSFGRQARRVVEAARDELLACCGAVNRGMQSDELVFCSGGTEANNLAILGLPDELIGQILVSSIEHPSVQAASELAQKRGRIVRQIPSNSDGQIDLPWLQARLNEDRIVQKPVALVAVMSANNETGVLQPVSEVGSLCRSTGVRFHIDAVQSLGKHDVSFQAWQADTMTICAHKLHGPVGIGALVVRSGVFLDAQTVGGFQQSSIRAGTESVALPHGFAMAAKFAAEDHSRLVRMQLLRDGFEAELVSRCNRIGVELEIIGCNRPRLPNTSCISFPPIPRQTLQMALDLAGVACSTGSACESGSATPSHVLRAMKLPDPIVQSAVRFSISAMTSESELQLAIERILNVISRSKAQTANVS